MGRLSRWAWGTMTALILIGGCARGHSVQTNPPPPLPQVAPDPLLETLRPVEPSPAGDFVASGLEGVVLCDRSGASRTVAAPGKRIRGLYWSPNGRWLLTNTEGPSVWLIEPATGMATDVTQGFPGLKDDRWTVSWAPDESVALVANRLLRNEPSNVWLFTPAAQSARKLTEATMIGEVQWLPGGKGDLTLGAGCCVPVHRVIDLTTGKDRQDEGFNARGSYSPNGRLFLEVPYMGASVSLRDMVTGTGRVIWRDVPPGDPPPAEATRYSVYPEAWSPDSRFVAYAVGAPGALPRTLRVMDTVSGAQVRLVRDVAGGAQWLPGSKGLLFATLQGKTLVVHLEDRILGSHTSTSLEKAVLSPDGMRLAYAVSTGAESSQLFAVNLESGEAKAVPDSANLFPLMWTVDGLLVRKAVAREVAEIRLIRP